MKKLIAVLTVASMMVTPVAARDYNMVDPENKVVTQTALLPAVQTAQTRGTDSTDQRYQMRVKKPGKPAPEFWYLLGAGVVALVAFALIDKGPNHGSDVGQAGVNKP